MNRRGLLGLIPGLAALGVAARAIPEIGYVDGTVDRDIEAVRAGLESMKRSYAEPTVITINMQNSLLGTGSPADIANHLARIITPALKGALR